MRYNTVRRGIITQYAGEKRVGCSFTQTLKQEVRSKQVDHERQNMDALDCGGYLSGVYSASPSNCADQRAGLATSNSHEHDDP